jgi:hypothetical protein
MSKELKGINAAIARALAKDPVHEVLSLLIGHFVGLTVELVRRRGEDVTKIITINGGDQRDITIHPPKDSPAKPLKREMLLGKKLFEFSSKTDWINGASRIWRLHEVTADNTTCVDQLGRICTMGLHFAEAERDDAYPIEVFVTRPESAVEGGAA